MNRVLNRFRMISLPGVVANRAFTIFNRLFVAFMMLSPVYAHASDVDILTPQPGATIISRIPEVHLVMRQAGPGVSSYLLDNNAKTTHKAVVSIENDGYMFQHFRLPLHKGQNRFTVKPDGQVIDFYFNHVQSDVGLKRAISQGGSYFHEGKNLPEVCQDCHELRETATNFSTGLSMETSCASCHQSLIEAGRWKHSTTLNQQCMVCHHQAAKSKEVGFPAENIQDICFQCHTGKTEWLSRQSQHGPMFVGGCTLCHNPHGGAERYQLFAEGSLRLCISCHSDMIGMMFDASGKRQKYVHGIIFGSGCIACHDPHASDNMFTLKKPINVLCISCHHEIGTRSSGHPVAGHPVSGPIDPQRPGREMGCTSCHDPHSSSNQYMLIDPVAGDFLCLGCHDRPDTAEIEASAQSSNQ